MANANSSAINKRGKRWPSVVQFVGNVSNVSQTKCDVVWGFPQRQK